jgi:DNA repair protein RecO (recombination protein O)
MRSYKDKGVIIKIRNLAEADRLVVIFAEKHGRIEAVAKGASKILSRKRGSIDLLNYASFALHETRGLDIITEAELINDYASVKGDLRSISLIFYILELLDKLLLTTTSEAEIFAELISFLNLFSTSTIDKSILIASLELRILSLLGFGPILDYCLHCGDQLTEQSDRIAAAAGQAGYLCSKHFKPEHYRRLLVADTVLRLQKYMLANDLQSLSQIRYDHKLQLRIRSIHQSWIEAVIEKNLNSVKFIEQVDRDKYN